jgi:hypothetical protein
MPIGVCKQASIYYRLADMLEIITISFCAGNLKSYAAWNPMHDMGLMLHVISPEKSTSGSGSGKTGILCTE